MGEIDRITGYPFYHPKYKPVDRRSMKQIKSDFNNHLKKFELSKTSKK